MGLIDLYPTLVDVCGLAPRPGLAGESLAPLLQDPTTTSDRHILTSFDAGNFAVTGPRWRYLRYADGNEELYDSLNDPHEWTNLAGRPEVRAAQQAMAAKFQSSPPSPTTLPSPHPSPAARKRNSRLRPASRRDEIFRPPFPEFPTSLLRPHRHRTPPKAEILKSKRADYRRTGQPASKPPSPPMPPASHGGKKPTASHRESAAPRRRPACFTTATSRGWPMKIAKTSP